MLADNLLFSGICIAGRRQLIDGADHKEDRHRFRTGRDMTSSWDIIRFLLTRGRFWE